jgi:hypothetical protein
MFIVPPELDEPPDDEFEPPHAARPPASRATSVIAMEHRSECALM